MTKFTGLSEQFDGGRAIHVEQEGPHLTLSVEAGPDCTTGTALITPGQAYSIAAALSKLAAAADKYEEAPDG